MKGLSRQFHQFFQSPAFVHAWIITLSNNTVDIRACKISPSVRRSSCGEMAARSPVPVLAFSRLVDVLDLRFADAVSAGQFPHQSLASFLTALAQPGRGFVLPRLLHAVRVLDRHLGQSLVRGPVGAAWGTRNAPPHVGHLTTLPANSGIIHQP